ncbi:HAD family hydrolase [Xanthomonas vesicatoria]|uniref:HAD family hydrolase n=2 Tax=Xanthomonas vesicatoria TaxID=56460 RepID=A0AAJ0IXI9_9XANT|nr:HAD family hydrolase [Xanthomonas vesicatoria]APO96386.1 HAD family hydrolase [Xanthomonas vesicatoria]EGD10381.1 haloacid dehalogenase superfamily enzyme, subfamily IA [Xanthomonas vesicatoria ATCC 35937]KHM93801.1 HAD family hydrolase [Xanthomonas vesicatoria]KHM96821.1 HAD family hydrolase [Xanthomonas vesicatoria]KTF35093.1 HAD family hydrolase [Xanthomonas vesicatoria]
MDGASTARLPLSAYRHWVFDMDGTLTLPVHDFALIRRALEIPPEDDILQHLAALPADQAQAKHAWLLEHERGLAEAAQPAPGAQELVRALHADGCRLGMLTRNARSLAKVTLEAIGLHDAFAWDDIVGRDEAAPKPAPDGLRYFQQRWSVHGSALVMVGDHHNDLACGRAVGAGTVLVNTPGDPWPGLADWRLRDCSDLLQRWQSRVDG